MSIDFADLVGEEVDRLESIAKRKDVVSEKKLEIDEHRVSLALKQIQEAKEDKEKIKNSELKNTKEDAASMVDRLQSTFDASDTQQTFLHPAFDNTVNFYKNNIIAVYAHTGGGKSSFVASLIHGTIIARNKKRESPSILVITNEELDIDVYGRIAALRLGFQYKNIKKLSFNQREQIKDEAYLLSESGMVTVMDDNWKGTKGCTTTPEGVEATLDKVIASGVQYDFIIIDYFQGIYRSKNGDLEPHKAQHQAIFIIDQVKKIIGCPIIIMSQVKKPEEDNYFLSDERQVGSKALKMKATDAIEMIPDYKRSRTKFVIHKSRFGENIMSEIELGYLSGRYVGANEPEYMAFLERKEQDAMNRAIKSEG